MAMTFHWVPARNGKAAEDALNALLGRLLVINVERHFYSGQGEPGWAICVEHAVNEPVKSGRAGSSPKVDYREVLDDESFRVFSALREWRKAEAAKQGTPVYAVMNNEQLAEAARGPCSTLKDVENLTGITPAQAGKRGPGLLSALAEARAADWTRPVREWRFLDSEVCRTSFCWGVVRGDSGPLKTYRA